MPHPDTPAAMPVGESQSAGAVLMVRPANFAFNPETAASNAFQTADTPGIHADTRSRVLGEFDDLAQRLQRAGVEVIVAEDTPSPVKPDAIFPNNWVSFHRDGTVVLYPMLAPNRRLERREDLLRRVAHGGFGIARTIDLTHRESEAKFLEGTGSLVLDRAAHVAYASLSPRTDLDVLGEFAQQLDYELVAFEACDAAARAIYHTNVLMAIGSSFAVVCTATMTHPPHRGAVLEKLRADGHEVLEISLDQMNHFAGNLLELAPPAGKVIAMSQTAWRSFDPVQRRFLERQGTVVAADVPLIERLGGGGVRCMLAEIHLPKRAASPVS
jgi:hypothetical protein